MTIETEYIEGRLMDLIRGKSISFEVVEDRTLDYMIMDTIADICMYYVGDVMYDGIESDMAFDMNDELGTDDANILFSDDGKSITVSIPSIDVYVEIEIESIVIETADDEMDFP